MRRTLPLERRVAGNAELGVNEYQQDCGHRGDT
jgi:hypothetical protein